MLLASLELVKKGEEFSLSPALVPLELTHTHTHTLNDSISASMWTPTFCFTVVLSR